jgi:multidrug efflux system membrane fusion protein
MTTNTTPTEYKHVTDHGTALPPGGGMPPSGKPKKRGLIWVVFLVIILAVAGYAVWRAGQPGLVQQPQNQGKGKKGPGGGLGPLPVIVAKAAAKAVPVYLNGLGNVTAFYTVTVKTRVAGLLQKVDFKEGDLVKAGQVLAEIDPRPYQVILDQFLGTQAHDQALLDDAKLDLDRYKTLLAQDAIPKQQLDTQVALVAQYVGSIKQDQANIDSAKLNLEFTKVVAPISGVVGLRQVDPGNMIQTTDPAGIIIITQLQPITVLFTIPEDSLQQVMKKLRAGEHLPVDAFNRDNSLRLASGTLLTMDNQINSTTGTSQLKAVFENKDFTLFPQQFVNIRLLVDTLQNQTVVPTVAVLNGQQGTFVYVIDDKGIAHMRSVQVLMSDQTGAAIKSGLAVGEQVAVDGADRLQDGSQVRIRQAGEMEREAAADAAAMRSRKGGKKGGGGGADGKGFGKKKGGGAPQ